MSPCACIAQFRGRYGFLSTFAPVPVWYEGRCYPHVEGAYQAAKTRVAAERQWVREARSPGEARRRGQQVTLREDWDARRMAVMAQLLRQKFTHDPRLRHRLLATGEAWLVHGNAHGDRFWGVVTGTGCNVLGHLLMEIRMEAQQELNWQAMTQASNRPPVNAGSPHETLLKLCADLGHAGIYLSLPAPGKLIAGPTLQVRKHPALLEDLRVHKKALLTLLEDCLAYQLYGTTNDTRFAQETCPDCGQPQYIVTPPRRLAAHRLPNGQENCPGSERAQAACATQLLDAFLDDRAVPRKNAVLTWTAFRGNFEPWCLERGFLRPPRPYLLAALDSRFPRFDQSEERPMWSGLTLTVEQWYGEGETRPEPPPAAQERVPAQTVRRGAHGKVVFKA